MRRASSCPSGQYMFLHKVENLQFHGRKKYIDVGPARIASRRSMIADLAARGLWKTRRNGLLGTHVRGDTYIYFLVKGVPEGIQFRATQKAREYLWILASTLYRWTRRNPSSVFGLSGDLRSASTESVFIGVSNAHAIVQWSHMGAAIPVILESRYFKIFKERRIKHFLGFIDDPRLTRKWKLSLWRAATLSGRSQLSPSLSEAFLYQVFALEALLLSRPDPKSSTLARRLHGLLGWAQPIHAEDVERLYALRSELVHSGGVAGLQPEDLHFADYLAFNALHNASGARRLWKNKQAFQKETSYRGRVSRWPIAHRFSVCTKRFRESDYHLPLT